jgi:hypothetical protein
MSNQTDADYVKKVRDELIMGDLNPFVHNANFVMSLLNTIIDLNERLAKLETTQPKEANND